MESVQPMSAAQLRHWRMRVDVTDPRYQGMKKLKLRGKELDAPPPEVFLITDLQVLDLSPERQACLFYHLPQVPAGISRLRSLRVLMLDTNDLPALPPEICALAGLERLSLSNNCLTALPEGFSQLQRLTSLHAANNLFQVFPEVVCDLPALTFLDMSDNRMESLPEAIGQLSTLETLLLYANRLTELPDSISNLSELRCLWIGQNRLTRLPRSMTRLARLDWGRLHTWSPSLDGNPLQEPPVDVCKQGVDAIGRYFKERDTGDGESVSEHTD